MENVFWLKKIYPENGQFSSPRTTSSYEGGLSSKIPVSGLGGEACDGCRTVVDMVQMQPLAPAETRVTRVTVWWWWPRPASAKSMTERWPRPCCRPELNGFQYGHFITAIRQMRKIKMAPTKAMAVKIISSISYVDRKMTYVIIEWEIWKIGEYDSEWRVVLGLRLEVLRIAWLIETRRNRPAPKNCYSHVTCQKRYICFEEILANEAFIR